MSEQATIRLIRARAYWRDSLRRYQVLVDGTRIGSIGQGCREDFAVAPGHHRIRLKIDWLGSAELSVLLRPGEVACFACAPRPLGLGGPVALLGKKLWITLERVHDDTSASLD